MKRPIFFILTALVAIVECHAQFVNEQQAQERVREFVNSKMPANARGHADSQPMTLAYSEWDDANGCPSLYVFNQPENGGFIIASADERLSPVLGYADTGEWNTENMPEALRALLADYGKEVREVRKQTSAAPRRAYTYDESWTTVKPLIKTKWGQNEPYNNLCPMVNGKRCITGCVATAFAQIMYYHRWPQRGNGSYYYMKNGIECYADFGSTTYQWDKMRLKYDRSDTDEDDAVATLMYHCGVAHNMSYTPYESYGYFNWWWEDDQRMSEIVKYFNYDHTVWGLFRNNTSELRFASTIYDNLQRGLPVLYNATPDNGKSAHVYICDGYDGSGYFHINWGWDGNGDGHYLLTAMKGYNINRIILYNITPPESAFTAIHATTAESNGPVEAWTLNGQRIAYPARQKGLHIVKPAGGKARIVIGTK